MGQDLLLYSRVHKAPDQLVGDHLVGIAGGLLAGGDRAFHCEVKGVPKSFFLQISTNLAPKFKFA